ncbi:IS30 family transposase [candidate division WOR-3 bacterium]|nr:IS30 family transposase [candidate division WOR-3 bacterium]
MAHERIKQKPGISSFFCNPNHGWGKGTAENLIGLIRRYLPNQTDFSSISKRRIAAIEDQFNSRPRKCLVYRTPYQASDQLSNGALTR